MSEMTDAFVAGCEKRGMTSPQIKSAAARLVELHPELRDEFEKAGLWPFLLGLGASAAAGYLGTRLGEKDKPAAEPTTLSTWKAKPPEPEVTPGAAVPPPQFGPQAFNPSNPFGGQSPFNHTVTPPMPKVAANKGPSTLDRGNLSGRRSVRKYNPDTAKVRKGMPLVPDASMWRKAAPKPKKKDWVIGGLGAAGAVGAGIGAHKLMKRDKEASAMEKEAWGWLVNGVKALLPRLANSGTGRAVGKGLSSAGGLFSQAPNAVSRAGQAVTTTGQGRAAKLLEEAGGPLASMRQSSPKPGFMATHGANIGTLGAMIGAPLLLDKMMTPSQEPQMERQASFPPTIGPSRALLKRGAMLPGGAEDLRDLPEPPPPRFTRRPPPKKPFPTGKVVGGGLAFGAGAATAYGIHKLTSPKEEKRAFTAPLAVGGALGGLMFPQPDGSANSAVRGAIQGGATGFGMNAGGSAGMALGGRLARGLGKNTAKGRSIGALAGLVGGGFLGYHGAQSIPIMHPEAESKAAADAVKLKVKNRKDFKYIPKDVKDQLKKKPGLFSGRQIISRGAAGLAGVAGGYELGKHTAPLLKESSGAITKAPPETLKPRVVNLKPHHAYKDKSWLRKNLSLVEHGLAGSVGAYSGFLGRKVHEVADSSLREKKAASNPFVKGRK